MQAGSQTDEAQVVDRLKGSLPGSLAFGGFRDGVSGKSETLPPQPAIQ